MAVAEALLPSTCTQRAVLQHGGTLEHIRVYGNELTMSKHQLSMRLLAAFGATAVRVGNKKCAICGGATHNNVPTSSD